AVGRRPRVPPTAREMFGVERGPLGEAPLAHGLERSIRQRQFRHAACLAAIAAAPPVRHGILFLVSYITDRHYTRMDVFEALAEPKRRWILDLLREGVRPAGELVEALGLSQPGVSKHLKVLREAGLVRVRAEAQRRLYRLDSARLAELDAWLAPYRRFWTGRLEALGNHLEKEQ